MSSKGIAMSESYVYLADFREHAPLPERGILSRTIHQDDRTKILQFCFAPGTELSAHTAPFPAFLQFLSGEADLRLGEDWMEAKVGTFAFMPALLEHAIKAKTEVVMQLVLLKQ
jgi:quercetin dioxygenase-like cupin family protein